MHTPFQVEVSSVGSWFEMALAHHLMVVADSTIGRELLKMEFEESGFETVAEANSGAQAIRLLERMEPDLVTIDLDSPSAEDIDSFLDIRRSHPNLPILVVSASVEPAMRRLFMEHGALACLEKPLTRSSMRVVMERLKV